MTYTADQLPSGLDAGSAIAAADLYVGEQGGAVVKFTHTQLLAFITAQLGGADVMVYKGALDCSANPNYPAADAGQVYIVSVAGKVGGSSGVTVEAGDLIICKSDSTAAGNQATVGSAWDVIQTNIVGAALTSGTLAQFAATTSAQLLGVISDETGTGALVFASAPTLTNPVVGTQSVGDNSTKAASTAYTDAAALAAKPIECIPIACSDETTALTTGTAKVTFRMPYAFTLTDVRGSVTTAPTGGTLLTFNVKEAGTTIFSTKPTFNASAKTTTTATTPRVISDTSLADDAEITIDIDAVGSTIAGAGLKVYLIGRRT